MEMVTLQGNKGHTGLTHPFKFFFHSGTLVSARVPKYQKIKKGGLDQYGAEHFGRLIFITIRKHMEWVNCNMKGVLS